MDYVHCCNLFVEIVYLGILNLGSILVYNLWINISIFNIWFNFTSCCQRTPGCWRVRPRRPMQTLPSCSNSSRALASWRACIRRNNSFSQEIKCTSGRKRRTPMRSRSSWPPWSLKIYFFYYSGRTLGQTITDPNNDDNNQI